MGNEMWGELRSCILYSLSHIPSPDHTVSQHVLETREPPHPFSKGGDILFHMYIVFCLPIPCQRTLAWFLLLYYCNPCCGEGCRRQHCKPCTAQRMQSAPRASCVCMYHGRVPTRSSHRPRERPVLGLVNILILTAVAVCVVYFRVISDVGLPGQGWK